MGFPHFNLKWYLGVGGAGDPPPPLHSLSTLPPRAEGDCEWQPLRFLPQGDLWVGGKVRGRMKMGRGNHRAKFNNDFQHFLKKTHSIFPFPPFPSAQVGHNFFSKGLHRIWWISVSPRLLWLLSCLGGEKFLRAIDSSRILRRGKERCVKVSQIPCPTFPEVAPFPIPFPPNTLRQIGLPV